eukprot:COSAG05_NODE_12645_length_460_cov_0.570637_1_plen_130_part_01
MCRCQTAASGEFEIFPAQALEAYWCPLPIRADECSVDDAPTLSGLIVLLKRLLELPATFSTVAQRLLWQRFAAILPSLPQVPYLPVRPYSHKHLKIIKACTARFVSSCDPQPCRAICVIYWCHLCHRVPA